MKLNYAKARIHEMRSSLNVVNNYVRHLDPSGKDEKQLLAVTLRSVKKLNEAVEELGDLINADMQNRKFANHQILG